ncbi:hypothetical protein Aspvir_005814 [Aspergillus viridinutans]|uniref:Uncharacterized protein n=1 Tax=Aspergillus viridinutans TaxID=75553 RepID=A0A9P3BWA1_ASPVI|nr:uncharacterized protein Aspvir_005814 [Aspergillus viridinutans]GIK01773.1 hypothetical protein Aspvir_005814 [Aspergillus viridinutans]
MAGKIPHAAFFIPSSNSGSDGLPPSPFQTVIWFTDPDRANELIVYDSVLLILLKAAEGLRLNLGGSKSSMTNPSDLLLPIQSNRKRLQSRLYHASAHPLNVWSLLDVFNTSPLSSPADTVYPYTNQILDTTNAFVVPGSCPKANPVYPNPRQDNQLWFEDDTEYYAVFYHGLNTVSVPIGRKTNSSTIPARFDPESSIIMVNIADRRDAPTEESVVAAGPLIVLEQPGGLTLEERTAV